MSTASRHTLIGLLVVASLLSVCAAAFSPSHSLTGVWYKEWVNRGSDCAILERLVQSGPNITSPSGSSTWYASLYQGVGTGYGMIDNNSGNLACGDTDVVVVVTDANLLTVYYMPFPPSSYCEQGYGGDVAKYTRRLDLC